MYSTAQPRIALVTGASGGIGAAAAQRLADVGCHVIVNYFERARGAEAVAAAIRRGGGRASTLAADVADDRSTSAMIDDIADQFGRLDVLVLNATVGQHEPDIGSAMRDNREAQHRLASLALPLMPVGAHIVFVTNHQAHFYPTKAVPQGYAMLAASKRAGETALYRMRSEFDRARVWFTVASADLADTDPVYEVETAGFWQRLTLGRRAVAEPTGPHPEIDEFAVAIADAASAPSPPAIVFRGRCEYIMTA